MSMILREGATSKRIDVVFDVYRETSIKNTEREKRGGYTGIEYRNIQPDHRIQQWRKFLSNPQNKKQLVRVVTEELQKEGFRQRLTGEHLCTTTEESCVEISADYFQTKRRSDVNSRGSRHQTSCSRISCSQEWFQGCCYIIRRYDVFLLCLAFAPNDQSYVLMTVM